MVRLVIEAMFDPVIHSADDLIINQTCDLIFDSNDDPIDELNDDPKFIRHLRDANKDLYSCCNKYTELSAILHIYHMKLINEWTNKSMEMLLEFLQDVIPSGETSIPKTMHDAKSFLRDLGFNYVKIDACQNNCVLYRK